MPTLACRICGRIVYTTASLDSLLPEERRCPRCGAVLDTERREASRRKGERRSSEAADVRGPAAHERRSAHRRLQHRRRDDDRPLGEP